MAFIPCNGCLLFCWRIYDHVLETRGKQQRLRVWSRMKSIWINEVYRSPSKFFLQPPEVPWSLKKSLAVTWSPVKSLKISWSHLKSFKSLEIYFSHWKPFEGFRSLSNSSKSIKSLEVYWSISEKAKSHRGKSFEVFRSLWSLEVLKSAVSPLRNGNHRKGKRNFFPHIGNIWAELDFV